MGQTGLYHRIRQGTTEDFRSCYFSQPNVFTNYGYSRCECFYFRKVVSFDWIPDVQCSVMAEEAMQLMEIAKKDKDFIVAMKKRNILEDQFSGSLGSITTIKFTHFQV